MWLLIEIAGEIAIGFSVIVGLLYLCTANADGLETGQTSRAIRQAMRMTRRGRLN